MELIRYRPLTIVLLLILSGAGPATLAEDDAGEDSTILEELSRQAEQLAPLVSSDLARSFLRSVDGLPRIARPRVVYYNGETRDALTQRQASKRDAAELAGYEKKELDEEFYYFTRYGTPLAFVRPLELIGQAGLTSLDGRKVADFGFGSIGQLRMMAAGGAEAVGIEVDPLLRALYSDASDSGRIDRSRGAGRGRKGLLRLTFGRFPADAELVEQVGDGFDLFVSKNTLKRGYVHPEQEVDPRRLIDLGVDDRAFVRAVFELLKPGGFFLIYNLHPAQSKDPDGYIPWADGRCPFQRSLLEKSGFNVIAHDLDDTDAARTLARALGWADQMNLETDLFATYCLMRKAQ